MQLNAENVNVTKTLDATTNDFGVCKFQFQVVLFLLHTILNTLEESFCQK